MDKNLNMARISNSIIVKAKKLTLKEVVKLDIIFNLFEKYGIIIQYSTYSLKAGYQAVKPNLEKSSLADVEKLVNESLEALNK